MDLQTFLRQYLMALHLITPMRHLVLYQQMSQEC